jgi:predicted nuclease of restriction endonuclease-like (RecB) superfamily
MLFERSAFSKKPDRLIRRELTSLRTRDTLTPDLVFRDPYFLDFELGVGFAFLERHTRITVDGEDFHLDLLLFHRTLRRLVAIDLKLDAFQPGDKGQMESTCGGSTSSSAGRAKKRPSG